MKRVFFLILFLGFISLLTGCGAEDANEGNSTDNHIEADNAESNKDTVDEAWSQIEEAGELVVGTSGTLIAASYFDGEGENVDELTGFDVEVMREIANRLGVDVSFEIMGIDGMLPAINSGRIDVAANDIEITDKRSEKFDFSEPYKYSYSTMVVRKGDYSGIESLEDLEGKKAGGGATTIYSQIAEHYGAEVVTYGNAGNEAYLRDVDNGRTDVVINDYFLCKFGVAAFPDFDITLHPDLMFNPTETAVIMPKGADELRERINGALEEMRKDGTLTELAEMFYKEDASQRQTEAIIEIEGLEL
ncbi:transporter substrate-binding domain-containing protein [Virgibacillus sp. W0430]|uniref:transporter substrate-binding domain-containing protein n=1 Tax=Virgibacillus sp. W0430 TaxID=3391580 RepID=UPI003F46155B